MSDLDPGVPSDEAPKSPAELGAATPPPIDLDLIERDLRDVESALARLADGTYFRQPGAQGSDPSAPGSSADSTDVVGYQVDEH